jgi:transcription termination factor Rho
MMRERYESLSLAVLKDLAKARGLKGVSTLRKPELIERMLKEDENDKRKAEERSETAAEANIEGSAAERADVKAEDSAAERVEAKAEGGTGARNAGRMTTRPSERASDRSYTQDTRVPRERTYRTDRQNDSRQNDSRQSDYRQNDNRQSDYRQNDNRQGEYRQSDYRQNDSRQGDYRQSENRQNDYRQNDGHQDDNRQADPRQGEYRENHVGFRANAETAQLDSGEKANGILEVMTDGYGFIRCENYMPGENDIYVSPSQIRRFNLKTGDIIQGNIRVKTQGEKFSALLYVTSINGFHPSEGQKRYNFENMTPIFPDERLVLERPGGTMAMRIVDLISPIGKGQRGMIVSPPKAGKTTLLKDVAKSILQNNPSMHLIILLIDERPEEVTDIREAIQGSNVEVIYSTFDELPDHHKRVSEMVMERAKRLVEHKKDVTILLDSITRLARAYNLVIPPSGRTLSGGLDPAALHMPKRFFGAARNMREGGSLTILATALVDTGSKMDDVIYEEFKGTGNMELVLDRKLQEKRVFPAIDIQKSGTRREDLLLDRDEQEAVYNMRRALNSMKADEAVEQILNMFSRTRNNAEFVQTAKKQKFF